MKEGVGKKNDKNDKIDEICAFCIIHCGAHRICFFTFTCFLIYSIILVIFLPIPSYISTGGVRTGHSASFSSSLFSSLSSFSSPTSPSIIPGGVTSGRVASILLSILFLFHLFRQLHIPPHLQDD